MKREHRKAPKPKSARATVKAPKKAPKAKRTISRSKTRRPVPHRITPARTISALKIPDFLLEPDDVPSPRTRESVGPDSVGPDLPHGVVTESAPLAPLPATAPPVPPPAPPAEPPVAPVATIVPASVPSEAPSENAERTNRPTAPETPPPVTRAEPPPPPRPDAERPHFALDPMPLAELAAKISHAAETIGGGGKPTESSAALPEAYGSRELVLTARDPHCLYGHWDVTRAQLLAYQQIAPDHRLALRLYAGSVGDVPLSETPVSPESSHWFLPVTEAATNYIAQLGYYERDAQWVSVATSGLARTPPALASSDTQFKMATIPPEVPFQQLMLEARAAALETAPLGEAIARIYPVDAPEIPSAFAIQWHLEQEREKTRPVIETRQIRPSVNSESIVDLTRRQLEEVGAGPAPVPTAAPGARRGAAPTSPSGPLGAAEDSSSGPGGQALAPTEAPGAAGAPGKKSFWFTVNAELVIYGATEPGAAVAIAGRRIKLRPDGSFSCRFALPNGSYELPVVAVSADGADGRAVELEFTRDTTQWGEVGATPQPPWLKPPGAAQPS